MDPGGSEQQMLIGFNFDLELDTACPLHIRLITRHSGGNNVIVLAHLLHIGYVQTQPNGDTHTCGDC